MQHSQTLPTLTKVTSRASLPPSLNLQAYRRLQHKGSFVTPAPLHLEPINPHEPQHKERHNKLLLQSYLANVNEM